MQRVHFKVVRGDDGRYVLKVDGADVGYTCCVSARLHLDKVFVPEGNDDDEFVFCVECKHVLTAIESSACAHGACTLEGRDATVCIRVQDPDQKSHEDCSELSTFVDGESTFRLDPLEFKMSLEIDLSKLKEMIKKARKAHTERLRICVYLQEVAQKQISLVVFSIDGDFKHEQKFCHETTRDEDGSTIVRAATDGTHKLLDTETVEPVFEGVFPAEKIDAFVKNLPCRMLTAKVKTGMPLMLDYPLGGTSDDESHIRFLVAAVNEDV